MGSAGLVPGGLAVHYGLSVVLPWNWNLRIAGLSLVLTIGGSVAGLPLVGIGLAAEDSIAEFYRGKTVTIIVGYGPGGGYDLYARSLARHIGRHIPGNPVVVVRNMPGAGSVVATNYLFNVAPRDGTVLATFGRGVLTEQLREAPGVHFDATRFNWIGSMTDEVIVCVARGDSGIQRFEDVFNRPLRIGGLGGGADLEVRVMNDFLGTKFELITGYAGGNEINLALERGEVQGRCALSWGSLKATRPQWLEQGFVRVLVQLGVRKHPDLPGVPLALEYARTEDARLVMRLISVRQAIARPFAAPPGVPPDRVAALRRAFLDTLRDPEFLAEAARAKLEFNNPMGGEEVEDVITEIFSMPRKVVGIIRQYL